MNGILTTDFKADPIRIDKFNIEVNYSYQNKVDVINPSKIFRHNIKCENEINTVFIVSIGVQCELYINDLLIYINKTNLLNEIFCIKLKKGINSILFITEPTNNDYTCYIRISSYLDEFTDNMDSLLSIIIIVIN